MGSEQSEPLLGKARQYHQLCHDVEGDELLEGEEELDALRLGEEFGLLRLEEEGVLDILELLGVLD